MRLDPSKLTTAELRKAVADAGKIVNRRVSNLTKAEKARSIPKAVAKQHLKPAEIKTGIKAGRTEGRASLMNKLKREKAFIVDPTSTVKGMQKAVKAAEKQFGSPISSQTKMGYDKYGQPVPIGQGVRTFTPDQRSRFWEIYRKLEEAQPSVPGSPKSKWIQEQMEDYNLDEDTDSLIARLEERLDEFDEQIADIPDGEDFTVLE